MEPQQNNPPVQGSAPQVIPPTQPEPPKKKLSAKVLLTAGIILLIAAAAGWWFTRPAPKTVQQASSSNKSANQAKAAVAGVTLDPSKNYGNKYANGVLPVGDQKYTTDAAKQGYIFACAGYANNLASSQGGAGSRGPWFVGTTAYDLNKKLHVQGNVTWAPSLIIKLENSQRIIMTNGLPNHYTGIFPIRAIDPAYAYDKNPNKISAQSLTYTLNAAPVMGDPQCIGGQVGVMLTGVALFNGFDAAARDAGAWEVQDGCDGHPEKTGEYHYHTLSSCIANVNVNTIIGYALDGYPITGPKVGDNNYLTTSDLDICHGITSELTIDNKKVTTYHYVMTQDFPYSISCFRSTAISPPNQPTGQRQQP